MSVKQQSLYLTNDERILARSMGLSFSSRARNMLVCNQAPRLGRLTIKQARSLQGQVWPRRKLKEERKVDQYVQPKSQQQLPVVVADSGGFVRCPQCKQLQRAGHNGPQTCCFCTSKFKVIG